jgi:cyclopropane-fatty-acyl-phospholipid synthase
MPAWPTSHKSLLARARAIIEHLASRLEMRLSVELWDGSRVPLGSGDVGPLSVRIHGPGVIGSLMRRPSMKNFVEHYATGRIEFCGGDLITFGEALRERRAKGALRNLSKWFLFRKAWPFLFCRADRSAVKHAVGDGEVHWQKAARNRADFVEFHYSVSNEFYELFLDPEMVYSCAYFKTPETTLEQAQRDKLDILCRKLQLKPGERFLDVGCGWGGLMCHAVRNYGVTAHGVTLSREQYNFAQEKIRRLGLEGRATVALCDYADIEGTYDKIASIGIIEHIGIANYPAYFGKFWSLLRDRGILVNQGIARPAKRTAREFRRMRPEHKLVQKYIFPGGELDHIGHTVEALEACKFEVRDVENLREHYMRTCRLWCQRLSANREKAIELVGEEVYRAWVAYLATFSFTFQDGSLRLFQTVAVKQAGKGVSGMPSTREHLYAPSALAG